MKLSIIETRSAPTVKAEFNSKSIIFHSKYDPVHEASVWAENEGGGVNVAEDVIVFGLGTGYHIQSLAEKIPEQKIIVIEFNDTYFNWFKKSTFYGEVTCFENVVIKQFSRLTVIDREKLFTSVSSTNLLIHKSGLDIIPNEYKGIKEALEDLKFQQNTSRQQIENLDINFRKNSLLHDEGISNLKSQFEGRPMILVSAGPSLDKQLPLLKKIHDEKHFVIGAVGTAIKPLVKFEIIPDFFTIIDPKPATYSQLTDIDLPKTPLLYLSTAYHDTILLHRGQRRIVYQEGYANAEKLAAQKNEPIIQTGGSVATALLDIMVYIGGKSIALIGQDLAYTGGKSHANESHAQKEMKELHSAKKVMNYYQTGEVHTAKNLNIYRKWFERYAEKNKDLSLYNCTEGGAYINNWEHIKLMDYYSEYSIENNGSNK